MLKTAQYIAEFKDELIFTKAFFQDQLQQWFNHSNIQVHEAEYIPPARDSIGYQAKTPKGQTHPIGVQHYQLTFLQDGQLHQKDVITKSKISSESYLKVISGAFEKCGISPSDRPVIDYLRELEFSNLNQKEVSVYQMQQLDTRIERNLPSCFGIYFRPEEGVCVLILQFLEDEWLSLDPFNTSKWEVKQTEELLKSLSQIHAVWYGKEDAIKEIAGFQVYATYEKMLRFRPYWEALANAIDFETSYHHELITKIPEWYSVIAKGTKTLVQNDCVPKNVALNRVGDRFQTYIYDWEISTIHLPQRDVVEFLCYALPEGFAKEQLDHYVDFHRNQLEQEIGKPLDHQEWENQFLSAAKDYLLQRVFPQLPFEKLEARNVMKLYKNVRRIIDFYDKS